MTGPRSIGLLLLLVVSSACGLTETSSHDDDQDGSRNGGAGALAGASTGASAGSGGVIMVQPTGGGGAASAAGAGGAGDGGAADPRGGTGAGGKQSDPIGGVPLALSCETPYAAPRVGPREDGPAPIIDCNSVSDAVLIERFEDFRLRVPQGFFFEPDNVVVLWKEPCSSSLDETAMRGPTDGMGVLEATVDNNPWFYEASYCYLGLRRRERNLRCDYFDGVQLGDLKPDNYRLFASLLWWRDHANQNGAAILGSSMAIGDATDTVELCTLEGTRGDFGLCDEIRLLRTRHRILASGEVRLGSPEVLRTVNGNCH